MLYQLVAGRPPFTSKGAGELINQHLIRAPMPLSELAPDAPAELVALVDRLLRKSAEQRPSMLEVVGALEQLQARQGAAGRQAPAVAAHLGAAAGSGEHSLSDSLAAILGDTGGSKAKSAPLAAGGRPSMAYAPTLGSGPDWTPLEELEPTAAKHSARLSGEHAPAPGVSTPMPMVIANPPTLPFYKPAVQVASQQGPAPVGLSVRWSLILGTLLGGAIVTASAAVLLPSRAALEQRAQPGSAATVAAAQVGPGGARSEVKPVASASATSALIPASSAAAATAPAPTIPATAPAPTAAATAPAPMTAATPPAPAQLPRLAEKHVPPSLKYSRASGAKELLLRKAGPRKRIPIASSAAAETTRARPAPPPQTTSHDSPPPTHFEIIE